MSKSNLELRKIKSLDYLYEINENGTILRNVKSKKQIKIFLDKHHSEYGYYAAFVCIKKKVKRLSIHGLVAECWLGDRPDGMQVDHIDRNSHNNHYSNLRYVNYSEQMKNRTLSARLIAQATKNCYEYTMKYVAKPVEIKNCISQEYKKFPSMIQCAEYLGRVYSLKAEQIRHKLKQRRSHIFDYDIKYYPSQCRD